MSFYGLVRWGINNQKIIKIILLLTVLLAIATSSFFTFTRSDKDKVEISVFPATATVEIAELGSYKKGTAYLPTGEYKYTVTADGYQPYSSTIRTNIQGQNNIRAILRSSEERKYSKAELEQIYAIEGAAGRDSQMWTENYRQEHPIIHKLPVKDMYYSIGYLSDPDGSNFRITIHTQYASYRNRALNHLRDLGVDPTTSTIEFTDFENPLTGENK